MTVAGLLARLVNSTPKQSCTVTNSRDIFNMPNAKMEHGKLQSFNLFFNENAQVAMLVCFIIFPLISLPISYLLFLINI